MGNIHRKDFSKGWVPSQDEINGAENAQLVMDNLTLDEFGGIELCRQTVRVNAGSIGGSINAVYSKTINGVVQRYIGTGGNVYADTGAGNFSAPRTIIGSGFGGSNANRTCFSSGFGQVFAATGTNRKKDDGTTVRGLGISATLGTPSVVISNTSNVALTGTYGTYTAVEGTGLTAGADYVSATADATTLRTSLQEIYGAPINATIGGGVGTPSDPFRITVKVADTTKLTSVRVVFMLKTPGAGTNALSDYFSFDFSVLTNPSFQTGANTWSTLSCLRSDFVRSGADSTVGWQSVIGVLVIFVNNTSQLNTVGSLNFYGGINGALNGSYQWVQVAAFNSGSYVGKSPGSSPTPVYAVSSAYATLTPYIFDLDTQANEIWWFRRGGTVGEFMLVGTQPYPNGVFVDKVTDQQQLLLNTPLNTFLASVGSITDEFLMMSDEYFERILFMTYKNLILSDRLNPDSYDTRQVIRTASNVGEKNLWMSKVSNSSYLLGTTNDIYEISGTLVDLPDGTIDVEKRSLGIRQPPISAAFWVDSNVLYYIAADGIRTVTWGISRLLSEELHSLWKGITRYGVSGIDVRAGDVLPYKMCIAKSRLYILLYHKDGSSSVFVHDIQLKSWTRFYSNPTTLFAEEDGTLLGGYGDGGLRVLDSTYLLDGTTFPQIHFRTTAADGGMPMQRKDTYTLKLNIDTGGSNVNVYLGMDGGALTLVGTVNSNGLAEKFLDVHGAPFNLHKRYALQITDVGGAGVAFFRLTDWTLDFDERPVPLSYMRVAPTDYGVAGRKRIFEIPFIIDTLNSPVVVTPTTDGNATLTSQNFTTADRAEAVYQVYAIPGGLVPRDVYSVDVGMTIQAAAGQLFEFYQMTKPRMLETVPDATKYYRTETTNLGSYQRKRFITIAFVIDTGGANVTVTPYVDNVAKTAKVFNTPQKTTVFYIFTVETIGIDVFFTIDGGGNTFEYYSIDLESCVTEKIPPQAQYQVVPASNYGRASKKRIRTMPFTLNTFGQNVNAIAVVDGVQQTAQSINTPLKQTAFYYFSTDIFGTDYGLVIDGLGHNFEFYNLERPTGVEDLPVGKLFDQIGPIQLDFYGKLIDFRIRCIAAADLTYTVFMDDVAQVLPTNVITAIVNKDTVYTVKIPKYITGQVCRIEFLSAAVFYRFDCKIHVNLSGNETDAKWVTVK
jgi:hypothetical protein